MRIYLLIAAMWSAIGFGFLFNVGLNLNPHDLPKYTTASQWLFELQNTAHADRRLRAVGALAHFDEEVVPEIVKCLGHHHPGVRRAACLALTGMGPKAQAGVPAILALAQNQADPVCHDAIDSLHAIGVPPDTAVKLLNSKNAALRRCAIESLARTGATTLESRTATMGLVKDPDPYVRECALKALSTQGPEAVKFYATLLRDENPAIKVEAAMAICKMKSAGQVAAPALLEALTDKNENVRFWGLKALAELDLRNLPGLDRLAAALNDPDEDVRWQAADTIARTRVLVN